MPDDRNPPPTATPATHDATDGFARFWLAIPDVVFRIIGIAVFLGYIVWRSLDYRQYFPLDNDLWQHYATRTAVELTRRGLIDLTYLLIVAGFCLRIRPLKRATDAGKIALAFVGAFWPFLPFVLGGLLHALDPQLGRDWQRFLWRQPLGMTPLAVGSGLVLAGLLTEAWGYMYLLRSLSIVPEARVLKVTGPYRFVRHPIYFGQFLAQAGVWLVFANTNAVWIGFYICFVILQLVRTRMEDRVLEEAFGDMFRDWKRRTFWFV